MRNDKSVIKEKKIRFASVHTVLASRKQPIESVLCEKDLEKAGRFIHKEDKERFLAARILLIEMLSESHELTFPLDFSYTEFGKPYIKGLPEFSWSHSGNMVSVCIAPNAGTDIEKIEPVSFKNFYSFFSHKELEWIDQSLIRFFTLWTIKESVMKAIGLGFRLDPLTLKVALEDNHEEGWRVLVNDSVLKGSAKIIEDHTSQSYALSYCSIL